MLVLINLLCVLDQGLKVEGLGHSACASVTKSLERLERNQLGKLNYGGCLVCRRQGPWPGSTPRGAPTVLLQLQALAAKNQAHSGPGVQVLALYKQWRSLSHTESFTGLPLWVASLFGCLWVKPAPTLELRSQSVSSCAFPVTILNFLGQYMINYIPCIFLLAEFWGLFLSIV